jgi:hypothetical protein
MRNGRDPILTERLSGLTNSEGNHGEDVKEYRRRVRRWAGPCGPGRHGHAAGATLWHDAQF